MEKLLAFCYDISNVLEKKGNGLNCKECGAKIEEGDKFCPDCGILLVTSPEGAVDPIRIKARGKWDVLIRTAATLSLPLFLGICLFLIINVKGKVETEAAKAAELFETRYDLHDQLHLANRYLEDLDYNRAVSAFQLVLSIDPKYSEAYMGMADAYIGMGDYEKAIEILRLAEEETPESRFENRRAELEALWNTVATLDGMVVIADDDIDYSNNNPLSGADIHLEKADYHFSADATADRKGYYHFEGLHFGEYIMTISARGYAQYVRNVFIYEMQTEVYNATAELIPNDMTGSGTASGKIIDALQGFGVRGLTLNIREGANNTSSGIIARVTTGADGYYDTPELPAGMYSAEIVDERNSSEKYIDGLINIKILGSRNISEQNGTVSTQLLTGQIRVVLSWGATPSDLDSHLFAQLDSGDSYHTCYYQKEAKRSYGNSRYAALDLDDTDCYGPETTTIYSQDNGDYTFVVYDFSRVSIQDIAGSGAVVQVYMGNSSMPDYTFYAPRLNGFVWEVFSYDSREGKITALNNMADESKYGTAAFRGEDYYDYY